MKLTPRAAVAGTAIAIMGAGTAYAATRSVDETATMRLKSQRGSKVTYTGTAKGKPFGSGTATMVGTLSGSRYSGSIVFKTSRGTVYGTATASIRSSGGQARYSGTARVTRGTGRYSGISGRSLKVSGTGRADGSRATLRLTGKVSY